MPMRRCASVAAAVVAAHLVLAEMLVTPEWAWHERAPASVLAPTVGLGVLMWRGWMWPVPFGLLIGAAAANAGSALVYGAVPNYFVSFRGEGWVAYNLPDVCLVVGGTLAVLAATRGFHRARKEAKLTDT
jgi:hypothetical protein